MFWHWIKKKTCTFLLNCTSYGSSDIELYFLWFFWNIPSFELFLKEPLFHISFHVAMDSSNDKRCSHSAVFSFSAKGKALKLIWLSVAPWGFITAHTLWKSLWKFVSIFSSSSKKENSKSIKPDFNSKLPHIDETLKQKVFSVKRGKLDSFIVSSRFFAHFLESSLP